MGILEATVRIVMKEREREDKERGEALSNKDSL